MELMFAIRVIFFLLTTTVIIICLFMESAVVPPKEKIPVPHKMDAKGKMTMKGSLERTRSNILNCDVSNNRSIEEGQLPEGAISHNTVGLTMLISKPSCKALISGKDAEYNEMKTQIFTYKYPYRPKTDYQLVTRNCHNFLRDRGYILNVTSEEIGFPLAYNILMFKDVEQVERLLRAIYRPSNFYCIHVDRKAHFKVKLQIMSIVRCFPNVFLSSRQMKVEWAGYSVLEAEMACMKDLLQRPGWKYFINLTGQEYPLKTNLEIVRILKILNGANSIDATTNK
ncbi:beta-1,3-galactosyl-O-glycosyl-glycoprotein beta-1,6-N-acetylglucosaminyltransferase-like [Haliotis rufescens]|uniref:beta-1,3-galactosyl-O-glycosyl-glycoprotein beta-1,6-N-acetylglucosaminyltransferase-like n=1 Tax=Haliotis rufescens TaxID=6454 RepID=UPI00201F43EF|nr:beta-1,3-galactosyl-O-glycosyl-glycoprotein beta-1,6-N-acetylglucosaminyltransferase-like [Haliotis rufescens]